jgi:hypothetical protein
MQWTYKSENPGLPLGYPILTLWIYVRPIPHECCMAQVAESNTADPGGLDLVSLISCFTTSIAGAIAIES